MDTPLYKLYLFRRAPAYYETPPQKIAMLRERMEARQRELGIRDLFNAEMAWSNEKFEYFGVEFYPSLKALLTYTRCLSELGHFQYLQGESYLGIPMDNAYPEFRFPSPPERREEERDLLDFGCEAEEEEQPPIYRVYFSRSAAGAMLVPEIEREEIINHIQEAGKMLGVEPLLSAFMRWNAERWEYFGIERFPNMETAIAYTQYLNEAGWYRITESESYLGTALGGLAAGGCAHRGG